MQFVGEAVREHMLQSGNYEQKLVVIGIAVLGRIANREAIKKDSLSIDKVEQVRWWSVTQCQHVCYIMLLYSLMLCNANKQKCS